MSGRGLQLSDTTVRDIFDLQVGQRSVSVSCAHHAALDPCSDAFIRVVDTRHAFAAVLTASAQCPAFGYLRMKLHKQLLSELQLRNGSAASFEAAISVLDKSWRRMHPFHTNILDGFKGMSMALADAHTQLVYLLSYGNSRAACTHRDSSQQQANGSISASHAKDSFHVEVVPLENVSSIVVGSSGLWNEVNASKVLLRLQAFQQLNSSIPSSPTSSASSSPSMSRQASSVDSSDDSSPSTSAMSSSASHLVNYALHSVTQRMQKTTDPRMRALSSVTALQSLWVGSRANHCGGNSRTPVRRKRGDVHGDLTAVVIELQAPGTGSLSPSTSASSFEGATMSSLSEPLHSSALQQQPPTPTRAATLWGLLRMQFLDFRRAARQQTLAQWRAVTAEAMQQAAAQHAVPDRIPAVTLNGQMSKADSSESAAAASLWPVKAMLGQTAALTGSKTSQTTQIAVRASWPNHEAVPAVAASA